MFEINVSMLTFEEELDIYDPSSVSFSNVLFSLGFLQKKKIQHCILSFNHFKRGKQVSNAINC